MGSEQGLQAIDDLESEKKSKSENDVMRQIESWRELDGLVEQMRDHFKQQLKDEIVKVNNVILD